MRTGTIVSFNGHSGFVRPDAGGENLYLAASHACYHEEIQHFRPGARVEFMEGRNQRGPVANHARLVIPDDQEAA